MENDAWKPVVMFVDDEQPILKAIKRVVNREPYETLVAEGGAHALEELKRTRVQVIISDLNMPQMDGLTLLKAVQQDHPETIRIILSGTTGIDTILKAINEGRIYRYITKPWDDRELVLTIRQALETWQVRREKRDLQAQLARQNRLLEKRVLERTEQLLAMERQAELGRYAAQIVHNLRGPLQVIIGQISLARFSLSNSSLSSDAVERHLNGMEGAVDNLTRIISGILRHSKNTAQFGNEWTQLNQVIENELQFFAVNKTFNYDVEKSIHLDGDLPSVWANPLHLQQVVDNLINNALDAMEGCQPKNLSIATYAKNKVVFVEVADTGTGIDPKHLPRIFEPDFTTKPPDKGTGLGLASVKAMVEGYGGHIEVRPNDPRGAKFIVAFPLKEDAAP